jgi:elongation factor G
LLETIRECGEAEGKFIRQIGGAGNYGHCKLRIESIKAGESYVFTSALGDDVLPHEYLSSIERGVKRSMQLGVHSGRHLVDLKVTVVDGSYHAEDSNPMAFEIAGMIALEHAFRNAAPVVLEPIMAVEIEVPEELEAATQNEIHQHRGRVETNVIANGWREIRAVVPLSELLVSNSGIAVCPMEFVGYEVVQDDGSSDESGSGVTANKPNGPKPYRRSEMARPDPEETD